MELEAMLQGLAVVEQEGVAEAVLLSDSQYVVNGLNQWLTGWIRNGWRTASGKPVKNDGQWKQLSEQVATLRGRGVRLTFEWVRGHNGDPGNELADQLANRGADSVADPVAAAQAIAVSSNGERALYRAEVSWDAGAGPHTASCVVVATSSEDAGERIRTQMGTALGAELSIEILEVVPGGVVFINKDS